MYKEVIMTGDRTYVY